VPLKGEKHTERRVQIERFFADADFSSAHSDKPTGEEKLIIAKDQRSETYVKINLLRVQRSTNGLGCKLVLMVEFIPDRMENRKFKSARITCTVSHGKRLSIPKIINFAPDEGYADKDGLEVKNEGNVGVVADPPMVKAMPIFRTRALRSV
jgi:hypothetical protein